GDFACAALGYRNQSLAHFGPVDVRLGGVIASLAVAAIAGINLAGLRTGAVTQNLLTIGKVAALLAIIIAAVFVGRPVDWLGSAAPAAAVAGAPILRQSVLGTGWLATLKIFGLAMMPVMWCYEGTTDSVKMTEEVR